MTKVHIISLAILAASIAAPEAKEIKYWLSPVAPVEYDKTYSGKLLIQRFSVKEKIPCQDGKLACAWRAKDGSWCYIPLATDKLLATEHHTYASAMRHELGHCNGWSGDHERERRIPRDSIKAPGLSKDTQYFPTDDLASICVRLDGSLKTCEPDDKWSACETPTAEGRLQYCKRPARVVAEERTPLAAANPPAVKSSQQTNPPTAADPPAAPAADNSDWDRLIARTYKRCLAERGTDDFKKIYSQKETEDYCGCFSVLINERVPKEEWQADMKAGTWVNNPKLIATKNYCSDKYLNMPNVKSIIERKW